MDAQRSLFCVWKLGETYANDKPVIEKTKINISNTILRNRKIFIYSGNVGVAQNFPLFLESVKTLQNNKEIGFLIIGSGSEAIFVKNYINIEKNIDKAVKRFAKEVINKNFPSKKYSY